MAWEIKWTHPWPVRCVDGSGGGGGGGGGRGGRGEDDGVVEEEKGKEKEVGTVVMDHVERSLIIELKSIQRENGVMCHVSCVISRRARAHCMALQERSNHVTHIFHFLCASLAWSLESSALYF